MKTIQHPKLTVVGAGPGDPELITLKGIIALQQAKVVLYDALVNKALLMHCSSDVECIDVGKRKGYCRFPQEEINQLIVDKAISKGQVVRLKGGDPFIFGRGAEEMEFAAKHGLETAYIAGISSSGSVPGFQNIPLTKRGSAESFWVITGTTKNHQISTDVALAAKSNATVVILMGMSKMEEIVALYKAQGKSELPIAIIQNGTTPQEKVGVGTIGNITQVINQKQLSNPAIIIIGEVVKHRAQMEALKERTTQYSQVC